MSCAGHTDDQEPAPTSIGDEQSDPLRIGDEELTPEARPPAGYSSFGGQEPRLRKWAEFYFYPNADIEFRESDGSWRGAGVIPGRHTAVVLDEGSVIENTTAHPQYYVLCILLPGELHPGQVIPLRAPESNRIISRQESWPSPPEIINCYSRAEVGEAAVSGMRGYDMPAVRPNISHRIGTATIVAVSPGALTLKVDATIPLRLAYNLPETHYNLKVHRTYQLRVKTPGDD